MDVSGGSKEPFGQFSTLSAATVFKNFELLLEQRPEIKDLFFDNGDESLGTLMATMKSPRISIEPRHSGNPNPEIYYSFIIDKGEIHYPGSPIVNINGWVITIAAKVGRMRVSPQDAPGDDERVLAKDALRKLQKTHTIPNFDPTEESSLCRLYAAVSEAVWATPDPEKSTVPIGRDNVALAEWERQSIHNHRAARKVMMTLACWASNNEFSPLFTLGLERGE